MSEQYEKEELELETISMERAVVVGEALEWLEKTDQWKTLIEEELITNKALASVSLLGFPDTKAQGYRPDVMEDLVAISNFQYFLLMVKNFHKAAIDDTQAMIDEGVIEDSVL
jgi:hypothetical protein